MAIEMTQNERILTWTAKCENTTRKKWNDGVSAKKLVGRSAPIRMLEDNLRQFCREISTRSEMKNLIVINYKE